MLMGKGFTVLTNIYSGSLGFKAEEGIPKEFHDAHQTRDSVGGLVRVMDLGHRRVLGLGIV